MNDLPPEILVHIFSFYIKSEGYQRFSRNIPLVCRRWRDLHPTPLLWVNINPGREKWSFNQLNILSEKGLLSFVRRLELVTKDKEFDSPFFDTETRKLICYCHNLIEVELSGCFVSKTTLDTLAEQCPNIQSLILYPCNSLKFEDLSDPFLKLRGQNLKRLRLSHVMYDEDSVSEIAKCCKSLEELKMSRHKVYSILPVDDLARGCLKLRKLEIYNMTLVLSGTSDHYGFANMVSLIAIYIDFGGMDLYSILKWSKNLEKLSIFYSRNVIFRKISLIPSDKLKYLQFILFPRNKDSQFLEEAVGKFKQSLTCFEVVGMPVELTKVVEAYLYQNPNPKLTHLNFNGTKYVEKRVLIELMEIAKSLRLVVAKCPEFVALGNREEVENYLYTARHSSSQE